MDHRLKVVYGKPFASAQDEQEIDRTTYVLSPSVAVLSFVATSSPPFASLRLLDRA